MLGDAETDWDNGINYKAISCEKIPDLFLDKLVAKNHFSKFGKITRFILRPSRQSCTVEYETEAQAERALDQAGDYNGMEFRVEYATREIAHVQNTEEWVNAEVQAELDAMAQRQTCPPYRLTQNPVFAPPKSLLIRPQKAISQLSLPLAKSGKLFGVSEVSRIETTLRQELEAIMRRPAFTDEEKYRVLDARDKLMRLIRPQQTDIKKVVSTKGICPDMCPEKERLMREFQRQVSCFEMCSDDEVSMSSISHHRAIKEYSRSSADQEVPLAHELRPESVLHMTMLYMMFRIMDLCDDPQTSIADWFHFVWDRTRSIRKDITQQELCSLGTVQLVEQCARFHIHCAARLVAEDPSVFDKKINAENLTKCLQTLKYMYHDLRIKGIHCPCEPEFRSYVVLLNLGDSNFLWELKQLPAHIQHSNQIKRAIAFYNTLQNNNYVRFFSMIRETETSYLSACILLGYFNKLRWRAMEAINKSHNWRKNTVLLPLTYLTRILGFEDGEAARHYFTYHGLKCDGQRVVLDRLKRPDIEYSMDRALKLVESKRIVSVGECVCGHTLESAGIFECHVPHNSFDANGILKSIAWTAEDQLRGEAAEERKQQREIEQQQQQQDIIKIQQQCKSPFTLPYVAASSTIRTDTSVFKVPLASPPISPKQQQIKQSQQLHKLKGSSIFEGSQFEGPTTNLAYTNYDTPQNNDANVFNVTGARDSVFKIPTVATKAPVAASDSSSSSIFGHKVANVSPPPEAADYKFNSTGKVNEENNIFSSVTKSTTNIFQTHQAKRSHPMLTDSTFQFSKRSVLPAFNVPLSDVNGQERNIFDSAMQQESLSKTAKNHSKTVQCSAKSKIEGVEHDKEQELEADKQREQQKAEEAAKVQRKEIELKHQATLKALDQKVERETEDELERIIGGEVVSIAQTELKRYHAFEKDCKNIAASVLDQFILAQLDELAHEEFSMMCHDQLMLSRYFERWLRYTRKKQKQRAFMESTPMWVSMSTRAEQVAKLVHPNETKNLQMIKRYRHGEPCNFQLLLWQHPHTVSAARECIDIFEVVRAHTVRAQAVKCGHLQGNKYFKLVLTLPNDTDELPGFESLCNKWLHKHVRRNYNNLEDKLQKDRAHVNPYICAMERDVALCVRKVSGIAALNEKGERVRDECDSADAIVCFMSCDNIENTQKRIQHLFKFTRLQKSVPLAFIVYDGQYIDELGLSDTLEMESLVAAGKVSAYKFFGCLQAKNEFSFAPQFGRALRFVTRESSICNKATEELEMQKLQSWLEACLGEALWQRWQQSSLHNPAFAKVCSVPKYLVELYNEALERVIEMTVIDLDQAPEFSAELQAFVPKVKMDIPLGLEFFPKDWKSAERQRLILRFLRNLSLPPIEEIPQLQDCGDWELWLLNYACRCIPSDDEASIMASYQSIKALIDELNRSDLHDLDLAARFHIISFLPVIKAIAFAQINAVLKSFAANADSADYKLPNEIIYRRQMFHDFQVTPWWLNTEAVVAVTIDYTVIEDEGRRSQDEQLARALSPINCETVTEIIKQAEKVSRKADTNLYTMKQQTISADTKELAQELDASIYQFELAKQIDTFDMSLVPKAIDMETESDMAAVDAITGGNSCHNTVVPIIRSPRKRKHPKVVNELDAVVARALRIIEKVEVQKDRSERLYTLASLELDG